MVIRTYEYGYTVMLIQSLVTQFQVRKKMQNANANARANANVSENENTNARVYKQ